MLGLERLMAQDEPHLVDGTVLSAHQVDALSGTLIALLAEVAGQRPERQRQVVGRADQRRRQRPRRGAALRRDRARGRRGARRGRRAARLGRAEAHEEEDATAAAEAAEDPNAARRFWFEHATGAGKTVAALGFVEATRTGGVLILTHRRNLVDQFIGELNDRGYKKRISPRAADRQQGAARQRPGDRRDLPVVRPQRRQDLRRLHGRDLRRGAHRARREDLRVDPQVEGAGAGSA